MGLNHFDPNEKRNQVRKLLVSKFNYILRRKVINKKRKSIIDTLNRINEENDERHQTAVNMDNSYDKLAITTSSVMASRNRMVALAKVNSDTALKKPTDIEAIESCMELIKKANQKRLSTNDEIKGHRSKMTRLETSLDRGDQFMASIDSLLSGINQSAAS